MMQEKFLLLADKMGLNPELIDQIKGSFSQDQEREEHYEEKKKEMPKEESKEMPKEGISVDITKKTVAPMPSIEELHDMDKDALIIFAKSMMQKPSEDDEGRVNGQKHSPYVMMMKKQGY